MTWLARDSACGTGHATHSTELFAGADGIRSPALEMFA